jgi:hypothetical protein
VPSRDEGLCLAVRILEQLKSTFDVQEDIGADIEAKSLVQDYFRIRTADISGEEAAGEAIGLLVRALEDLRSAPVSGATMTREVAAIRQVLTDFGGPNAAGTVIDATQNRQPLAKVNTQRWYFRWIVAHQLHALFNVCASMAIGSAIGVLHEGDPDKVSEYLRRATIYVQGFSPARAHALAIPSWYYNEVLRPSMAPPLSSAPLSGRMHLEYKGYRTQVSRFLAEIPQGIHELAKVDPELAFAREALLEADLLDSENHVCLIEPVVGHSKSLIQNAQSGGSAVTILRQIRERRATMLQPFIRDSEK